MVLLGDLAGVLATLLAWLLAAWVLAADRQRGANRVLALLLACEGGIHLIVWDGSGPMVLQRLLLSLAVLAVLWLPWAYLLFLARLPAPATRWLRHPRARPVLHAVIAAEALLAVGAAVTMWLGDGTLQSVVFLHFLLVPLMALYGLVATLSYVRATRFGAATARSYAWAFGTRDALFVLFLAAAVSADARPVSFAGRVAWEIVFALPPLATMLFCVLLARGMLRHQVAGVDLRLHRLHDSAVAALLLVAAFAVVEALRLGLRPPPVAGAVGLLLVGLLAVRVPRWSRRLAARTAIPPDVTLGAGSLAAGGGAPPGLEGGPGPRYAPVGGSDEHHAVALAHDVRLQRPVVLKRVPSAAGLAEARAMAAVRHPNLVTVYDVSLDGGGALLVAEHVQGTTLRERLRDGPVRGAAFRRLATGLLAGLQALHAAGLVHRDVKPANILLDGRGEPRLADLGIAAQAGAPGDGAGTPRYMSPEQAAGSPATPAADLYSAALCLVEAWLGHLPELPAAGTTATAAGPPAQSAAQAHPVHVRLATGLQDQGLPPALARWAARALHPVPQRRHISAEDMALGLEDALA